MKNTYGQSISVTVFGESHGDAIGIVADGLAPGIEVDEKYINQCLSQRKAHGTISTARQEADEFRIVSGVFNGFTTGTPLTLIIENKDTKSKDYSSLRDTPRPSHADYTAERKYHGFQDYRGGGHFSGRITAPIVALGAILRKSLEKKGIVVGTHIKALHGVKDRDITSLDDIALLNEKIFPVLDFDAESNMLKEIEAARAELDSVGGILETVIHGMPVGVGEPFFDSMESVLSHVLFSIPAVKGVEFGAGFAIAEMRGSEANDEFIYSAEQVRTVTNNSGGIQGGITNGMPIVIRCAVKPTPSIYKEQATVSLSEKKNTKIEIKGRHDPAIIHRARAVVDAMCAIAIADMLTLRYGTDYLK